MATNSKRDHIVAWVFPLGAFRSQSQSCLQRSPIRITGRAVRLCNS